MSPFRPFADADRRFPAFELPSLAREPPRLEDSLVASSHRTLAARNQPCAFPHRFLLRFFLIRATWSRRYGLRSGRAETLPVVSRRRVPAPLGPGPPGRRGPRHAGPAAARRTRRNGSTQAIDSADARLGGPDDPGGPRPALPDRRRHQPREPGQGDPGAGAGPTGPERLAGLPGQGPQRGGRDRRARGREPERRPALQAVDAAAPSPSSRSVPPRSSSAGWTWPCSTTGR